MAVALEPCVSVVIPTRNRPAMVTAAVESVLAQTAGLLEVIVVIDGPDPATVAALTALQQRLASALIVVMALEASVGGSEARNCGVRQARGAWIAFLDDDDVWLPHKLVVQMELAERCGLTEPVIASAVVARGPSFEAVWPRRIYQPGESMAEYLFCREGWTYGAALLQTSTLLAPRALLLRVPFQTGLKKHQDWDWLLRVSAEPGVEVVQAAEPLAIFHVEGNRASVGRAPDWRFSLSWARERRSLFTNRAYSAFVATECAPQAARAGATVRERFELLCAVVNDGSPTLKLFLLCCALLFMPQQWRHALRDTFRGGRERAAPAPAIHSVHPG